MKPLSIAHLFTVFLLIFSSSFVEGQRKISITGNVLDEKTKVPLPFVNIFLEGTTIGTQTDLNGNFTLTKIPLGKHKFVASMVGYLSHIQDITSISENLSIKISLKEDIKYLSEVKVSSGRDKVWERQMKIFEREFLGSDFSKKNVKILNREVIDFKETRDKLEAFANQPIVIENRILGYKYTYILQNFERDNNRLAYKGLGRFELIDTVDAKIKKKYERNRADAYNGSIKHFIKTFLNGNLEEMGYRCYYLNKELAFEKSGPIRQPIIPKNSVFATDMPNNYLLVLDCPLLVYYEKTYPTQISELKQLGNIFVGPDGDLADPYSIQINGDMSNRRIAKTLPYDYELPDNEFVKNQNVDISNLPNVLKSTLKYSREKIDIFGIEPYYLAGEKIELDIFVKDLSTQNASEISKTLYVDLIDLDRGKLIMHHTLRLEHGFANFKIPTNNLLPTGNYKIRAYTNWMRNFSETGFFDKKTTIFSQKYQKELSDTESSTVLDSLIIHIEGNKLVEGLRSKVLIETLNNFEERAAANFQLISSAADTLIQGETDSTGIGIIELLPESNKNYHILMNNRRFYLPQAQKIGTTLTVDNLSNAEKIRVFIQNKVVENLSDTLTVAIIREGEVLFWQSYLNNKPAIILNVPKENLSGILTVYLIDKYGEAIAERQILAENNDDFTQTVKKDRELIAEKPKNFIKVDKDLPFWDEKGINIKGRITRMNGKPNKKPVKLSLMLTSLPTDSIQKARQSFSLQVMDKFSFEDLQFYGKRQATFIAPENRIIIDSSISLPPIYTEKAPINWHLIQKTEDLREMEKRKEELFEESLAALPKEKMLDEIKVIAKKPDKYAVEGISPNYVMEDKQINYQPFMKNILIDMLISPRRFRFSNLSVYIDNMKVQREDFVNIDELISPGNVDNISIFEFVIPSEYAMGGTDCAIVIKTKTGLRIGNNKENEVLIIKGYDY